MGRVRVGVYPQHSEVGLGDSCPAKGWQCHRAFGGHWTGASFLHPSNAGTGHILVRRMQDPPNMGWDSRKGDLWFSSYPPWPGHIVSVWWLAGGETWHLMGCSCPKSWGENPGACESLRSECTMYLKEYDLKLQIKTPLQVETETMKERKKLHILVSLMAPFLLFWTKGPTVSFSLGLTNCYVVCPASKAYFLPQKAFKIDALIRIITEKSQMIGH